MGIWRLIKAIFYRLTGQMNKISEGIESDPIAMKQQYNAVIKEKASRRETFLTAVAALSASHQGKVAKHVQILEEMRNLDKIRKGAMSKIKARADKLIADGKTQEEVKKDSEYMRHSSAYKDFSKTFKEKETRAVELEDEAEELGKQVSSYQVQLETLNREIDKIQDESIEAIADTSAAAEKLKINRALSNLPGDSSDETLKNLREARSRVKSQAKIYGELAGAAVQAQEADYMAAVSDGEADDELDSMIFGSSESKTEAVREKLPE